MPISGLMMQAIRSGGAAAQVTPTPTPAPAHTAPTTLIGIVNGYSEGSFWSFADQTKNFSDAGVTQVTNGGLIQQTNDLCTRANHLVMATSSHRPTWGDSGATFAGGAAGASSGSAMRTATAGTSSRLKTWGASIVPTGPGTIFGSQTGNSAGFFNILTGGILELYSGTSLKATVATLTYGTPYTVIAVDNNGTASIYLNGTLLVVTGGGTSGSMGASLWTMLTLGNDGNAGFTSAFYAGLMKGAFWVEGNLNGTQIGQAHTDLLAM